MSLSICELSFFPSSSVTLECHLCNLKPASSKLLMTFYLNAFADAIVSLPITSSMYTFLGIQYCLRLILLILLQVMFYGTNLNTNSSINYDDNSQNMGIMWQLKTCESRYYFSSVSCSLIQWNLIASQSFLLILIWKTCFF